MIDALGNCCTMLNGGTPSKAVSSYWNGSIPFITSADIADSRITGIRFNISQEGLSESATNIVPAGTVLLVTRTGVGKAVLADRELAFSQDITAVIPSPQLDPRYLCHFLQASRPALERAARGATIKGITRDVVSNLAIPLPPLPEQRRIAAILDHADALRTKRRAAKARLNALLQSIFVDRFGDPINAPLGPYSLKAVGDFVREFETGKSIVASDEEDTTSDFRVLKISAVTSGQFDPCESKALPNGYIPPPSHFVKAGDLLLSRANTANLIGATAFVYHTPENLVLPDKIWRFAWMPECEVVPQFVWQLFLHPSTRHAIGQLASGTSGSMKNISKEKVMSMRLAIPPFKDQSRFARVVEHIRRLDSDLTLSLERIEDLTSRLSRAAFDSNQTEGSRHAIGRMSATTRASG